MHSIEPQVRACRDAATAVAALDSAQRQTLLKAMSAALLANAGAILAANARDLAAAKDKGVGTAMLDRLALDPARLMAMAEAVAEVAALDDPLGQVTRDDVRPNGIRVQKVRIPLGVIAMIYEARPNVTAEAAALCLKAGNAVVLRGGSEALHSNAAIAQVLGGALRAQGVPEAAVTVLTDQRREAMLELLQLHELIDLAIPRGGEGLIRFVAEHARVPVIKHYKGVCHLYVDRAADLAQALALLVDGKCSRPAACNAVETLLVHAELADAFLPQAARVLAERGVQVRADPRAQALMPDSTAASEEDYAAEFLDLVLAVKVVDDLEHGIAHIQRYTSDHTEVIASADPQACMRFVQALRSAVVMVNTSSRFSDGGQLGLGSEIGISTTRLHAYGPMGLEALTIERFVVSGEGQVRG